MCPSPPLLRRRKGKFILFYASRPSAASITVRSERISCCIVQCTYNGCPYISGRHFIRKQGREEPFNRSVWNLSLYSVFITVAETDVLLLWFTESKHEATLLFGLLLLAFMPVTNENYAMQKKEKAEMVIFVGFGDAVPISRRDGKNHVPKEAVF